jgi:hypothetical protein
MHLANNQKSYNAKCRDYIDMYNDLDVEKDGLEVDIEEILHDFKNDDEFKYL